MVPLKMVAQLLKDTAGEFQLSGTIDFESVPKLLKQSQTLFSNNQDISVNLHGVEQSNSAGLALLIHWLRLAQEKQCSIEFKNIPAQLQEIAKISGIGGLLIAKTS